MSVSSRDARERRQNSTTSIASSSGSAKQPRSSERSHMESAVTKLLVATRQLLDALTHWSTGKISETEVSDVYVRLGNDFNSCVSAFQDVDISMSELLNVPVQLRTCLEKCLADEPSQKNLERYLPEIRTTIVALLQGLKTKQALYKTMKEEERRRLQASTSIREADVARSAEDQQRRAARENDMRAREDARIRAADRERSSLESERTRERERSGGGGLRRDAVERQASTGDGRWIPPQSQHAPRGLPAHPTASSSGQAYSQSPAGRSSSGSSAHGSPGGLSPAINLGSPINSFASPQQSFHSPQPSQDSERPYSTMSSSTNSSDGSATHSISRRANYPTSRGHRSGPLPDPPADAFRPTRRVPSNQSNPTPNGGGRSLSVVGGSEEETLANGRQSSRSPPPPVPREARSDAVPANVTRHSLIDPPVPELPVSPPPNRAHSPTPPNAYASTSHPTFSDDMVPRAIVRHSLVDPPSPPPQFMSSVFQNMPAPPTLITPSPPLPSAEYTSPTQPPAEALNLAPPALVASPSAVDQSLSALRSSERNISRRASQRYSTYQIGKIMDVGGGLGIPGTTGPKRPGGSRRGSDIGLGDPVEISGGPLMGGTSPSRPSRAPRGVPPLPNLPAGVTGSPLRGGGFVPPSEDRGSELREADEDEANTSWGATSSSASTSTIKPSTSSHALSQQLTPPAKNASLPTHAVDGGTESEPSTPDAISVFLLHGRECKKVLIPAGPTIPSVRLLFMEKFNYSAGGDEFPTIYVRDPKTEWRYEWEEGDELRDGVQLSLNIEPLDQVKQHIDSQMTSLSRKLEDLIRESVGPLSSQFATLQASNATLTSASNRMSMSLSNSSAAVLAAAAAGNSPTHSSLSPRPPPSSASPSQSPRMASPVALPGGSADVSAPAPTMVPQTIVTDLKSQFDEVQSLRRELGAMRQIHVDGMRAVKETFLRIRKENQRLRDVSTTSLGAGRAFVNAGKVKLDELSQGVLRKVEDLTDTVEELHIDVTEKTIVPKPNVMRSLKKEITEVSKVLEDLVETTRLATTTWRTTWSQEMEAVVTEEKLLSHHMGMTQDIEEDFKALKDVFDQLEVYAAHKAASATPVLGGGGGGRGRGYRPPSPTDKDPQSSLSSVLFEIQAQGNKADPEKRLKAIEQAQRMRQRELAEKGDGNELSSQLSEFVDKGKLKKTGGIEETERVRERKNLQALRNGVAAPAGSSSAAGGLLSPALGGRPGEGSGSVPLSPVSASGSGIGSGDVPDGVVVKVEMTDDDSLA